MRNRSSKQEPKEINEIEFHVAREVIGDIEPKPEKEKNPHAVALGRAGGLIGGKMRAVRLSAEERSGIARKAAQSRWSKNKNDG